MHKKILLLTLCFLTCLAQAKVAPLAVIQGRVDSKSSIYPDFIKFDLAQTVDSHAYATLDFYPSTQGYYEIYFPAIADSRVEVNLIYNNAATNLAEPQCLLEFRFDSSQKAHLKVSTLAGSMVSCYVDKSSPLDIVMEDNKS